jgi:hypothetical protein
LILKPKATLLDLNKEDQEAAEILSNHFSGYATVREFYDIRDDDSKKDHAFRKKTAASTLLTIIASAADNIQGGLFDQENPAVIPVDGLLVLLGEASIFINQTPRLLTHANLLTLLRAIEDLSTVHPRILASCTECLGSTLASAHGAPAPDPRDLMKKSISDLTASTAFSQSTGFSLVGSSMLGSKPALKGSSYAAVTATGTTNAKGNQNIRKRGWDWRSNFPQDLTPERLFKKLRLGLAEEVGRAWIEGDLS